MGNQKKMTLFRKNSEKKQLKKFRGIARQIQEILLSANLTVNEAERMTDITSVVLNGKFSEMSKKVTVKELGVKVDEADKTKKKAYQALIALLAEESVADAVGLLSGFNGQIRATLARENMERKYEEVKMELLD